MALSCSDASRGRLLVRERIACVSLSRGCARGDDAGGDRPATWESLKHDAPPGLLFGWKDFYDEGQPVFCAEQTMSLQPTPMDLLPMSGPPPSRFPRASHLGNVRLRDC